MQCNDEKRAFQLSKKDVAALVAFASTDPTRPHISCVRFEPEAGTAVSTDGFALVAVKNGGCYKGAAFQVAAKPLADMAKLLKKNDMLTVEHRSSDAGSEVIMTAPSGAEVRLAADEQLYPEWRTVVPAAPETAARRFGLNAKLLARLELVQSAAEVQGGVYYAPETELAPMRVMFDGIEATWTAVIMPMRA